MDNRSMRNKKDGNGHELGEGLERKDPTKREPRSGDDGREGMSHLILHSKSTFRFKSHEMRSRQQHRRGESLAP